MVKGPPKTLDDEVKSVRWHHHVQVATDKNHVERSRAKVRGWSPEREEMDNRGQYSNRMGGGGGDMDSRYGYNLYPGGGGGGEGGRVSRSAQSYTTYSSQSLGFCKYEDTSRTEGFHDCQRTRDKLPRDRLSLLDPMAFQNLFGILQYPFGKEMP